MACCLCVGELALLSVRAALPMALSRSVRCISNEPRYRNPFTRLETRTKESTAHASLLVIFLNQVRLCLRDRVTKAQPKPSPVVNRFPLSFLLVGFLSVGYGLARVCSGVSALERACVGPCLSERAERLSVRAARVNRGPTTAAPRLIGKGCEPEYVLWDPKDGELVLGRTKPRETSVEVRRAADVQIARHIRD